MLGCLMRIGTATCFRNKDFEGSTPLPSTVLGRLAELVDCVSLENGDVLRACAGSSPVISATN